MGHHFPTINIFHVHNRKENNIEQDKYPATTLNSQWFESFQ